MASSWDYSAVVVESDILTSSAHPASETQADRTAYQRAYWQRYSQEKKRISGVVPLDDYSVVKALADQAGRSLWGQVWAEAQAYRNGYQLATPEVAELQRALIVELRRIGNHLAALGRDELGHDHIAVAEALRQVGKLEDAVAKFDAGLSAIARNRR